jgi:hypothetical protein
MDHLVALRVAQADRDVDPLLCDDDAQELPSREMDRVAVGRPAGEPALEEPAGGERREVAAMGARGGTAEEA